MCTTSIILPYKTRSCVHALYPHRTAWKTDRILTLIEQVLSGLQSSPIPASPDTTVGWYRPIHREGERSRTPTFACYRPGHRQGKRSTTTRTQARSTALGKQADFEEQPWTIHTASVYWKMDSPYTPFLQQVWCETQIFRHVETQDGSAINQFAGRSRLLFSRYIFIQT